jgi:pimeloyl-ACP methyl ester carboxylesterase/DNA-binding SARP family transcriptional activator
MELEQGTAWPEPVEPPVQVCTLGRFRVEVGGSPLRMGRKAPRKALELLKVLIALEGQQVAEDRLSEALWPDADGDRAHSAFTTTLHRLRNLVGHRALTFRDGRLGLDPHLCRVDALELAARLRHVARCLAQEDEMGAWQAMLEALELYQGPFLDGEFEPPEILSARERLHGAFVRHVQELVDFYVTSGELHKALLLCQQALERDDVAEELHQQLMYCHLRQSRLAEGIAAYERCRRVLEGTLGVAPAPETERIHQALRGAHARRQAAAGSPATAPADDADGAAAAGTASAAAPAAEAERRPATVAVIVVCGLTDWIAQRDPEEAEAVLGRIKSEAVRLIRRHGGIVNHVVREEIGALFGFPQAHEDDPVRAVEATLALAHVLAPIGLADSGQPAAAFRIQAGIHSGLMVIQPGEPGEGPSAMAGEPPHVAARLAAQAAPGEVLVSAGVCRLVEPFFRVEPCPLPDGGAAGAPPAWRVREPLPVRSRFDAARRRGFTPFAGREPELRLLERALEQTRAGRGRLVTVVGEAGMGKSRLLHEFAARLDPRQVLVLRGRCQSFGGGTPYLPLIELLRDALNLPAASAAASLEPAVVAALRALEPGLTRYLPLFLHLLSVPSTEPGLPDGVRDRELRVQVHAALTALFAALSARQPVVALFEAWQWADEASQAAVRHLAALVAAHRLLVVVSSRPEGAADWGHAEHHLAIRLSALESAQSERLVRGALRRAHLPEGLAARLHEHSGGNPLFLEEACRDLLERGILRVRNRRVEVVGSLEQPHLPDTVRAVIQARLDRLDPGMREVVQLAAVIGRRFPRWLLERIAPAPAAVQEHLERMTAAGMLEQVQALPEAEYAFTHVLTRDVAYETILLRRRRALHLQVARELEGSPAQPVSPRLELLATHFVLGEAWASAAGHFLAAAQHAKGHFAYRDAVRLARQAEEAAERGEAATAHRFQAQVLLGDLRGLMGQAPEANAHYDAALRLGAGEAERRAAQNRYHHPRVVERAGARVAYYLHGSGSDTLFLIGPVTHNGAAFQPLVERLCQEFRVLTFDPRGMGASDPIGTRYGFADHVSDIRAVIEAAGGAPAIGVGVCKGGSMLVRLASAAPELIKLLVVSGMPLDDMSPQSVCPFGGEWVSGYRAALRARDYRAAMRSILTHVFSDAGAEEMREQSISALDSYPGATLKAFFARDPAASILPDLERVRVPTLVMHGTDDRLIPLEASRVATERIPGAQFHAFEGRGHFPQYVATAEFCEMVRQFVRSAAAAGPAPGRPRPRS